MEGNIVTKFVSMLAAVFIAVMLAASPASAKDATGAVAAPSGSTFSAANQVAAVKAVSLCRKGVTAATVTVAADGARADFKFRCSQVRAAAATSTTSSTTTTVPPEFPKEVPIDSITDPRVQNWAQMNANGNTTVVEVALGVYADKGHQTTIGPVSQYTSVYGVCADVEAFKAQGHSVGDTCW